MIVDAVLGVSMSSLTLETKKNKNKSLFAVDMPKIKHYISLLMTFVHANIKNNHRDKLLGLLWTLLDPLMMMLVYLFLVMIVFHNRVHQFPIYLYTGLIAWRYFSLSCTSASTCFKNNRALILASSFPRVIIPLSVVLSSAYDFIFSAIVLVFLYLILQVPISFLVVFVPLVFLLQTLFNLGWAMMIAVIGVRFTDLSNILTFVMRLGWYLSPGLYAVNQLPEKYLKFYMLNPMAIFFETYRDLTLYRKWPDLHYIEYVLIVSVTVCLVGLVYFIKNEQKVIKYI